jgi:AraC-like DNA-binding protein
MVYSAYQDTQAGISGVRIVSSGHIFAPRNRRIERPNGRNDYLLFYVAKGSEHMFLDRETVMEEGAFVIFRPHEKQIHVQKDHEISEFYYIHFQAPEGFDLFGFESSAVYSVVPGPQIHDLFEEVIEELQQKRPAYEKLCVAKLFQLLALLERKSTRETAPLGQYVDTISFVIQKMNKEYEKNYSLEEYAQMCCMGKFHFLRVFKAITGHSPIAYRNNIRIEHAKELLTDTDDLIDTISANVGYTSNVYFCDAFKEKVGMSPSQYRKTFR